VTRVFLPIPAGRPHHLLGLALLVSVFSACGGDLAPSAPPLPPAVDEVAFLNQDPEVAYVGRDACRRCHYEIYSSYTRTGMGRAFTPVGPEVNQEEFNIAPELAVTSSGLNYRMSSRDGRAFQRQFLLGAAGEEVVADEREVTFILGSGNHSRSYVTVGQDGLMQMPICWYPQESLWDLCPGYQHKNDHFTRAITSDCVFCHNGRMTLAGDATNIFQEPIPTGIGCERCHGPGALHVEKWTSGSQVATGNLDPSIVNPRRLPPDRRIQVCYQCHFGDSKQGTWVIREQMATVDWRPGMPISESILHLRYKEPLAAAFGISSQGDRLTLSRCFTESEGRLECLTCHNPHVTVYQEDRPADHFNARCMACHQDRGCTESPVARTRTRPADDCVACHMRRAEPDDHPHTLFTDHWIRRRLPDEDVKEERNDHTIVPAFPESFARLPADEQAFAMGQAYVRMALTITGPARRFMRRQAESHLRRAVDLGRDTAPVWFELGRNFTYEQRWDDAATAFRTALLRAPDDREIAVEMADVMVKRGQIEPAATLYRAILQQHPDDHRALAELGRLALTLVYTQEALDLLDQAVASEPFTATHHANRGMALERLGRGAEALAALHQAAVLDPENAPVWLYYAGLLEKTDQEDLAAFAARRARFLAEQDPAVQGTGVMGGP
jgi:hypothetical protein